MRYLIPFITVMTLVLYGLFTDQIGYSLIGWAFFVLHFQIMKLTVKVENSLPWY